MILTWHLSYVAEVSTRLWRLFSGSRLQLDLLKQKRQHSEWDECCLFHMLF